MKQSNQSIRKILDQYDIKHCQVAYYVGVNKWTFSRWMSEPLTKDRLKRIYDAIDKLVDNQEDQLNELSNKIEKRMIEC